MLLILRQQVISFKSPLRKGDSGGCVFSGLFPFSRGQVYNPLAPFIKGDFEGNPFSKGDSLCHTSYNPHKQNENSYTIQFNSGKKEDGGL